MADIDWTKLAGPLAQAGGLVIGGVLGGPAGAALGPLIGQTLATALGVEPTPDAVGSALGQPGSADVVKRIEAAQGTAIRTSAEIYLADVQSARQQTVDLAKADSGIAWSAPVVSVLIVAGFLTLTGALLFRAFPDNQVAVMLTGSLATAFGQVVNYWLGSSNGSAAKTEVLSSALQKLATKGPH